MHQNVEPVEHKIHWKKWKDPFIIDESELGEEFDFAKETFRKTNSFSGHFLTGPGGIIPLHEGNRPSTLFNFWRADTNFRLTYKIIQIIDWVDGVESFNEITPYRFRISIGRLFDEKSVMGAIDKALIDHLTNKNKRTIQQTINEQKWREILNSKYKFWAMIIQNTGKLVTFGDEEKATVKDKVGIFKKVQNDIARIIYSWE